MIVQVLLFGPQAQVVGQSQVVVEIDQSPTCADLRQALDATVPALSPSLADSAFAVNHEYAHEQQTIGPRDEIALIGRVSGG